MPCENAWFRFPLLLHGLSPSSFALHKAMTCALRSFSTSGFPTSGHRHSAFGSVGETRLRPLPRVGTQPEKYVP